MVNGEGKEGTEGDQMCSQTPIDHSLHHHTADLDQPQEVFGLSGLRKRKNFPKSCCCLSTSVYPGMCCGLRPLQPGRQVPKEELP